MDLWLYDAEWSSKWECKTQNENKWEKRNFVLRERERDRERVYTVCMLMRILILSIVAKIYQIFHNIFWEGLELNDLSSNLLLSINQED